MFFSLAAVRPPPPTPSSHKRTGVSFVKTGSGLYKENGHSFGPAEQFKITGEMGHVLFSFSSLQLIGNIKGLIKAHVIETLKSE